MRLILEEGGARLVHGEVQVALDGTDLFYIVRMTPMGRKVYFRNKAKETIREGRDNGDADILLAWSRLPAGEWSFGIPVEDPA